jgi:hypothetical protein
MEFETKVVRLEPKSPELFRGIVGVEFTKTQRTPARTITESEGTVVPTGRPVDSSVFRDEGAAEAKSLYPHVFDADSKQGLARGKLVESLTRAQGLLDAFDDSDLGLLAAEIGLFATTLGAAQEAIEANKVLSSLLSFMRRAALAKDVQQITRASLFSLVSTVRSLADAPLIDLSEAAILADGLQSNGWDGSDRNIAALLKALLAPDEEEGHVVANAAQTLALAE